MQQDGAGKVLPSGLNGLRKKLAKGESRKWKAEAGETYEHASGTVYFGVGDGLEKISESQTARCLSNVESFLCLTDSFLCLPDSTTQV